MKDMFVSKEVSLKRNQSPLESDHWSPPVVINELRIPNGILHVAREDLLPGGTKQRAIVPYLRDLQKAGFREVVYASPFCGFAQVALAVSGAALGIPITLFCECDPTAISSGPSAHFFSRLARSYGAKIHLTETLAAAEAQASRYGAGIKSAFKVPLGFRDPIYMHHMRKKLSEQYELIKESLGWNVKRIWLPVGSGTIASLFSEIVAEDCTLHCIDVRVLAPEDPRIRTLSERPNVILEQAEELFSEKAKMLPPLPSNTHYDAKLWSFITAKAQDGDLWWNVAR